MRDTIKRGPAVIDIGGTIITPQSDVTLELMRETFDVETSTKTQKSKRVSNVQHKLSFTPDGRVSAGILSAFYGFQARKLGQSVFGDDDVEIIVHWKNDNETMTFPAGAITKPPDLTWSAAATLFGAAEITCLGAQDTQWTDAAKFLTIATAAEYNEAANLSQIITESPTVAWGATAPWSDVRTLDGVKVGFNLQLAPDSEDRRSLAANARRGHPGGPAAASGGIAVAGARQWSPHRELGTRSAQLQNLSDPAA